MFISFSSIILIHGYRFIFSNMNPLRPILYSKSTEKYASIVLQFYSHQNKFLSICHTINQTTFVIFVISFYYLLEYKLDFNFNFSKQLFGIFIICILTNIFLYYIAHILAKNIFYRYKIFVLTKLTFIVYILYTIFLPFQNLLFFFSKFFYKFLHLFNSNYKKKTIISHIYNTNTEQQLTSHLSYQGLFENIIKLNKKKLIDLTIPLQQCLCLSLDTDIETIGKLMKQQQVSKVLFYQNNPNIIIGYYRHIDIIDFFQGGKPPLHQIISFQKDDLIFNVFYQLIKSHKSLASIKDGNKTIGFLTIEDILDQIFGQIFDVYNLNNNGITAHFGKEFLVYGSQTIAEIEQKYHTDLNTVNKNISLNNYLNNAFNTAIKKDDRIVINNWEYTILHKQKNKIIIIKITKQ